MESWDEVRTAFHVARLGTVSGAAEVLGVHHATVIRHIDALESRLSVKLFQRHARGYNATEAGEDLLRVAQAADDQFGQLLGRLKGQTNDVAGDLVVTSLSGLSSLLVPALGKFRQEYPSVLLRYLTGERLFRMEYGEAHVAIRAGQKPEQPDNVVQSLGRISFGMYASRSYADRNGIPNNEDDFKGHVFVASDDENSRAPYDRWLRERVEPASIVFRASNDFSQRDAILSGVGIGFLTTWDAKEQSELVQVIGPKTDWCANLWLVTHMDLHRTKKVQAFLRHLKSEAEHWEP